MRVQFLTFLAAISSALLFAQCKGTVQEKWSIVYSLSEDYVSPVTVDTIIIDAGATSLRGEWLIRGNHLFYVDYSLIPVREYNSKGVFLGKHIQKGRGPGEAPVSFNTACFDSSGNFVTVDQAWNYDVRDTSFSEFKAHYKLLSEYGYKNSDWAALLSKPDPENDNMYEFNLDSRRIRAFSDKILVAVTTEHVIFNAFEKINSKRFWSETYNFMVVDPYEGRVVSKFGHYPEIYKRRHIPSFYEYHIDVSGDRLFTGYAADTLIYVRDLNGKPIEAFGRSFDGFDDRFPENSSFSDYEATFRKYKAEQAYYQDIKVVDGLVFRTYKKAFDHGYGVQVYKDYSLIAEISFKEPVRVIGTIDGLYYAAAPADVENDVYRIYRIKL